MVSGTMLGRTCEEERAHREALYSVEVGDVIDVALGRRSYLQDPENADSADKKSASEMYVFSLGRRRGENR
jgi:hypothetical protein